MTGKTTLRVLRTIAMAAGLALTLLAVAPAPIGGRLRLSIVHGTSMQPTYEAGDLVLSTRRSANDVGDVVVFSTTGGEVIHRIVGGDGAGGFTTQGDNRTAVDEWSPTNADVVGQPVLALPRVGSMLLWLQDRLGPGGLLLLSALALAAGARRSHDRGTTRRAWPLAVRESALASAAVAIAATAAAVGLLRASTAPPDVAIRLAVAVAALGALGFAGSLLVGSTLGIRAVTWRTDIALRHRLVDVTAVDRGARLVASVSRADALVAAAAATDTPVLRHTDGIRTTYEVATENTVLVLVVPHPGRHATAHVVAPST